MIRAHPYYISRIVFDAKSVTIMYPAGIYMHKVNIRNTKARCKISSKLTVKQQNDANGIVLLLLLLLSIAI